MVLNKSSAQYAFLQVLAHSYTSMLNAFQATTCVVNPQVFQNCSDIASYGSSPPQLPTTSNTYPAKDNYDTYYYSDYSSFDFYGFNSVTFPSITPNLTTAAVTMLLAACASNDSCTKAYTSFNNSNDALMVVNALVTTNINTIQSVLNQKPKNSWIPSRSYAYFSQMYTELPSADAEVYGMHNAVVYGIANGIINGTTYENISKLSSLMYGGASMYETLVHTAAIGSFAYYVGAKGLQSNINLTAPQIFHNIHNGYIDTKLERRRLLRTEEYETKWDVWLAESQGFLVWDKESHYKAIQERARLKFDSSSLFDQETALATAKCKPPASTSQGIDFLTKVSNGCAALSYAVDSTILTKALSTAVMEGGPGALGAFGKTAALVAARQLINLCSSSVGPCYLSSRAWQTASDFAGVASLILAVAAAGEAAGPLLIAGASVGIGCNIANEVLLFYQEGLDCCSVDCTSIACQQSIYGCTQVGGIC